MKLFLVKTGAYVLLCLLSILVVFCIADGSTDAFYIKFTTPKQTSLVVGSSRAAQGVVPDIVEAHLNTKVSLFNYAFTIAHSCFGSIYMESIRKKLDPKAEKGLFIVAVNPWTVSISKPSIDKVEEFREEGSFLGHTSFVNLTPNIEYLTESFKGRNIEIVLNKDRVGDYQTFYAHDNGWLEVTIESDMFSTQERTDKKMKTYSGYLEEYQGCSDVRWEYLKQTVELLQRHGKVILLRIPVNDTMYEMEKVLMADFDEEIEILAQAYKVPYINAMPHRALYEYTDGHHLNIPSAKQFSIYLANEINKVIN